MSEYSHIIDNYNAIARGAESAAVACDRNADDILILSVSKTHPIEAIIAAMQGGISHFGENYVQELRDKQEAIVRGNHQQPNWHFIGHLQTNKMKYIAPFVAMIHSVGSAKLAKEIDRQAEKNNRTIDILLQVNTSGEESKSGVQPEGVFELAAEAFALPNIKVKGLMTIGTFADDVNISIREFSMLRDLREKLQKDYPQESLTHLSMGMTNDYETAIAQGATIVRIGTAIFGQRDYKI